MDTEERRLKSFGSWPPDAAVKPGDLARAGFFYQDNGDEVECFTCQYKLAQWEPGDDPKEEHRRHNPNCSFISETCCVDQLDSVMIKAADIAAPVPSSCTQTDSVMLKAPDHHTNNTKNLSQGRLKVPAVNITKQQNELNTVIHHTAKIELEKADYSDEKMRLQTFKSWRQAAPNPCHLAEAGFVYTGQGDKIQCFNCEGTLYDLGENMNVVNAHVCESLKKQQPVQHTEIPQTTAESTFSNMGSRLEVRSLQNSGLTTGSSSPRSPSPSLQNTLSNTVASPGVMPGCQGMADCPSPRDTLFEPCGHFICCYRCAENCPLCPSCKQFIQVRLQLSVSRVTIVSQN